MGKVKGTGVVAVLEYLEKNYGREGLDKVKAVLSAEDQQTFVRPILPITWIDFGYYMRMIVAADRVLGRGDFKVVEAAARYNMNKNFQGAYRILISFVSPEFAIKRAGMIWKQWFDTGKVEVERVGEKHMRVMLSGYPDIPPYHEYNLNPSFDEIMRLSGAKNPRFVHSQCVLKGNPQCVWDVTWEL